MRRKVLITLAMLAVIAAVLYTAHAIDLVGMIVRAHGEMNLGGHGG